MTGAATLSERSSRGVVSLDDPEAVEVERFGGKGANLARLRHAGFSVPDAFLVEAGACAALLSAAAAERDRDPEELAAAIHSTQLPQSLAAEVESCLDSLGPLAVRSSAVREDGAGRAAAGQYESVLGVADSEGLADACRAVVASQFAAHARSYWGSQEGRLSNEMALILQRMLAPTSSGVIFTADPVRGRKGVFVLEACFGLGTSVVRGDGGSERATIRRGGEVESRSLHKARCVECFDRASASVVVREQSGEAPDRVLSEAETIALIEVAASVEDLLGMPVDIEWSIEAGRLFLLQARPITTGGGGR
jgi:phosphoenolpyruvate synthase/pyruvate phosphate dikinase